MCLYCFILDYLLMKLNVILFRLLMALSLHHVQEHALFICQMQEICYTVTFFHLLILRIGV